MVHRGLNINTPPLLTSWTETMSPSGPPSSSWAQGVSSPLPTLSDPRGERRRIPKRRSPSIAAVDGGALAWRRRRQLDPSSTAGGRCPVLSPDAQIRDNMQRAPHQDSTVADLPMHRTVGSEDLGCSSRRRYHMDKEMKLVEVIGTGKQLDSMNGKALRLVKQLISC